MEEMLVQLREVAEIKASILKQEALLWQKMAQAMEAYVQYQQKMQFMQHTAINPAQAPAHNKRIPASGYMSTKEAAKYINMSRSMLEHWRIKGDGPRFIKMGGAVRYRAADLDEYIASRVFKHTSAYER